MPKLIIQVKQRVEVLGDSLGSLAWVMAYIKSVKPKNKGNSRKINKTNKANKMIKPQEAKNCFNKLKIVSSILFAVVIVIKKNLRNH